MRTPGHDRELVALPRSHRRAKEVCTNRCRLPRHQRVLGSRDGVGDHAAEDFRVPARERNYVRGSAPVQNDLDQHYGFGSCVLQGESQAAERDIRIGVLRSHQTPRYQGELVGVIHFCRPYHFHSGREVDEACIREPDNVRRIDAAAYPPLLLDKAASQLTMY